LQLLRELLLKMFKVYKLFSELEELLVTKLKISLNLIFETGCTFVALYLQLISLVIFWMNVKNRSFETGLRNRFQNFVTLLLIVYISSPFFMI